MQSRRQWLKSAAMGLAPLACLDLLHASQAASPTLNPLAAQTSHFPARAKRIIFLFLHGGPSHVDTFDFKPLLIRDHGKPLPFAKPRVQFAQTHNLLQSPWEFKQCGQSGQWFSSLFPALSQHADLLTFIKSLHGSNEAHGGALLKIHTGSDTFVRPSMGSWISYGLGAENANLPSFITLTPTLGHGGVQNFGAAFLPAIHQGTRIGQRGDTLENTTLPNLQHPELSRPLQQRQLQFLEQLNRNHLRHQTGPDAALEARIQSFELAFRMQTEAPELMDLSRESEATQQLYGIHQAKTAPFGRQCLLARRFIEQGVRFVQCSHGYWDQHSDLQSQHSALAAEIDRPISGLLHDLQSRGLLEDTLVVCGGEFGRTPTAQGKDGRDHNPHAFTWWFAGGGLKPGYSHGLTDEYGYYAVQDKVHIHDLHATLLHLMGLDHERLTYRYGGRDFRLTDVAGQVIFPILA